MTAEEYDRLTCEVQDMGMPETPGAALAQMAKRYKLIAYQESENANRFFKQAQHHQRKHSAAKSAAEMFELAAGKAL